MLLAVSPLFIGDGFNVIDARIHKIIETPGW